MKITFIAEDSTIFEIREKPRPASEFIPEWYKNMPISNGPLSFQPFPNVTAKRCSPLRDGLTSGYIVTLYADVVIDYDENNFPRATSTVSDTVFEPWPLIQSSTFEIPEGFQLPVFKYKHGWIPKTPKGYSCLITHPHGYQNSPFWTLTGVVDTDVLTTGANAPFVLRKGFKGIIPKGTPMFQIMPFKRENWEASYDFRSEKENYIEHQKHFTHIMGFYTRNLWTNKTYK